MENAQFIGNLKGKVAAEGTFIEIIFPEKTTFDTVVIKEKDNQIDKFSIWLEDEKYAKIAAEVDDFMEARSRFEENLFALRETGCQIYDVSRTGIAIFSKSFRLRSKNCLISLIFVKSSKRF